MAAGSHFSHYLPRDSIGRKGWQRRRLRAPGQGFAVSGIIVPMPAGRLAVGSHQRAKVTAHPAVKVFHDNPLARLHLRVGIELPDQELGIGQHCGRYPQRIGQLRLLEATCPVLAGSHHQQAARLSGGHVLLQTLEETARLEVVNGIALVSQIGCIVSHGAKEQHQLFALVGQAMRARCTLYQHDSHVLFGTGLFGRNQRWMSCQQLVPQDPDR